MKKRGPAWWLFWGSLGLILYSYIGFPLLIALRGLLRSRPVKRGSDTPKVSIIIAAYNEAAIILQKLDNTLALNYPRSFLEVIVASDGSTDGTNQLVKGYNAPEVQLLALPRQGKNHTLNAAVATATGEILVFSDADSMLTPNALRYLVAPFSDAEVGGVGGDYRYATTAEGKGEHTYWAYDRLLKRLQSDAGSMTSATGQVYAIRRSLFRPIPVGITDDFFTSTQIHLVHQRLIFEPRAFAQGPIADSAAAEFRRKVRIITGGLRGVWQVRPLLNPAKYGFLSIQIFSHKVLRRLMFVPVLLMGVTAPVLWQYGWVYKLTTIFQLGLHGVAILGFSLRSTPVGQLKIFSLPLFFDMTYTAAIVSIVNLLRGQRHDIWIPHQRLGTAEAHPTDKARQI